MLLSTAVQRKDQNGYCIYNLMELRWRYGWSCKPVQHELVGLWELMRLVGKVGDK